MTLTLEELKAKLAVQFDECELIDLLELTTFDLVDILEEHIEEQYDKLIGEVEVLQGEEDE